MGLKIVDNDGLEGLASFLVVIKKYPPQIKITKFEIADSADKFILRADLFDLGILDFYTAKIDWGDGGIEDVVTDQEPTLSISEKITACHYYNEIREYMVKLEARDDKAYFTSPKEMMGSIISDPKPIRVGLKKIDANLVRP